ncbi:MAG: hypothetical protein NZM04_05395 [Methylacidiphilales bacterium]|nr:hypothetical protein [Candidatus Methylacidiphilales bacterium]
MACYNLPNNLILNNILHKNKRFVGEIIVRKIDLFFILSNILMNNDDISPMMKASILIHMGLSRTEEARNIAHAYTSHPDLIISFAAKVLLYYIERDDRSYKELLKTSILLLKKEYSGFLDLLRIVISVDDGLKLPLADMIEELCKCSHRIFLDLFIRFLDELDCHEHVHRIADYILKSMDVNDIAKYVKHPIVLHELKGCFDKLTYKNKRMFIENIGNYGSIGDCEFLFQKYDEYIHAFKMDILDAVCRIVYRVRLLNINKNDLDRRGKDDVIINDCNLISERAFKYISNDLKESDRKTILIGLCGNRDSVDRLKRRMRRLKKFKYSFILAVFYTLDRDLINDLISMILDKDITSLNILPSQRFFLSLIDHSVINSILDAIVHKNTKKLEPVIGILIKCAIYKNDIETLKRVADIALSKGICIDFDDYVYMIEKDFDFSIDYFKRAIKKFKPIPWTNLLEVLVVLYTTLLISKEDDRIYELLSHIIDLDLDRGCLFLLILSHNSKFSYHVIYNFSPYFISSLDNISIYYHEILDKKKIIESFYEFAEKSTDQIKVISSLKIITKLDKSILEDLLKKSDIPASLFKNISSVLEEMLFKYDQYL